MTMTETKLSDEEIESVLATVVNCVPGNAIPEQIMETISQLHDEVKALREDKRRLDWAEECLAEVRETRGPENESGDCPVDVLVIDNDEDHHFGPDLREAIDAALQQEKSDG